MRACIVLFVLLLFQGTVCLRADDVPVAPLQPVTDTQWGRVYVLQNDRLEAVVSPRSGGVVSLRHLNGTNLLSDTLSILPTGSEEEMTRSLNALTGSGDPVWDARGWRSSDGARVVMLSRNYGPPLQIRITHIVRMPGNQATLDWHTRITATGPSSLDRIPEVHIPLARASRGWSPAQAGAECGEWGPFQTLPEEGITGDLISGHQDRLLRWTGSWDIESETGPVSVTPVRWQGGLDTLTVNAPAITALPPQGWTRSLRLDLQVLLVPADGTPCQVLQSLPATP